MSTLQDQTRKLASYSAAAALGAFGAHQAAQGSVIYTNLDPDLQAQSGQNQTININNSGYHEVSVLTTGTNIQVRKSYAGVVLTSSGTYYVKGFNYGDLIGATANAAGGSHIAAKKNGYNFFVGDQKYVGIKFTLAGQTHFGWIGFQVDSTNPLHAIIRDYAYESDPNTAIAAGVAPVIPEPGTLALLAAGAGAMALGRRRREA
jgi:hypothetical protein